MAGSEKQNIHISKRLLTQRNGKRHSNRADCLNQLVRARIFGSKS